MNPHRKHRGFSLIELMIALSAGLVISGAAVVLVASIVKSNNETLRSSRLTQELRATTEIMARELMRARSVSDPIYNLNQTTTAGCDTIDISTAGCVKIGYDCNLSSTSKYRTFALAGNKVRMDRGTASPACPTSSGGVQITSPAVNITALTFTKVNQDAYTINISGQLAYAPTNTNSATITTPTRSYSETVRVRSPCVAATCP